MLKILIDADKDVAEIIAIGNTLDLVSEISFLIREIWRGMDRDDPEHADAFKGLIQDVVRNDASPLWERTGRKSFRTRFDLQRDMPENNTDMSDIQN